MGANPHPNMRYIVIPIGGSEDAASDDDAETLAEFIREKTKSPLIAPSGLACHIVSDRAIVNRITYLITGLSQRMGL